MWDPVVERLGGTHRVLALDLPGHGAEPPQADGSPPALAAAIADRLAREGIERPHVAGNSLGGWVALEMAVAGRAASVTAIAPAGLWREPLVPMRTPLRAVARALMPVLGPLLRTARGRRLVLAGSAAHPERIPPDAALRLVRAYATAPGFQAVNDAMRASRFTRLAEIDVPVHARLVRARPARRAGRGRCPPAFAASCCTAAGTCRRGTTRSRWLACCWRAAPSNVNPGIEEAGSTAARVDCRLCSRRGNKGDNRHGGRPIQPPPYPAAVEVRSAAAAAADAVASTALSNVQENIVKPSSRKAGAWSGAAHVQRRRLAVPSRRLADPAGRVLKLRPGEVELAAEVGRQVRRPHQQAVDVGQRGDRVDRLERARALDLHDAGERRVGLRAEVRACLAEAVAARERRDPARAGVAHGPRRPLGLLDRRDLRHDHAGGARVEHAAGLRGPVGHAHDDRGVRVGGLDLRARRVLVAGPVLEVDDHHVEAGTGGQLGADRRAEVEEGDRQRLAPP